MKELSILENNLRQGFKEPFEQLNLLSFITGKSKRIRSRIAILYLKTYGIAPNEKIYNILAAGEIIHNASLLHDDVIDNASIRRGEITTGKKFSPKIAILAGDYLVSYAIEKLTAVGSFPVLERFKSCTSMMSKAEIQQYFMRSMIPSPEDYISICKGKTASLFSAILWSCAHICNIKTEDAETFGDLYGTYFQIKNDCEPQSAKNDRMNGINTAVNILGVEKSNHLLHNYLEEILKFVNALPDNKSRHSLEDLIKNGC